MTRQMMFLLLSSFLLAGCARLGNLSALNSLSDIPAMTEPDLDEE